MRYTFRQLEVFLAVARDGSVSRAARTLGMSQSAASGSLAELERQFDLRLFDRVGKRLALSAIGRSVRARAEAVLEGGRELERTLTSGDGVGRLRVGATMTIGNYLAVPLIARFLRQHPGADVTLSVGNTEEIARQVGSFDIDVGLIEGEIAGDDLEVTAWRDDELVVFCAAGHPFARKRALDDGDLRGAAWIVREHGSGTRQAFDRAMRGLLPDLRIALTLQHTEAIKGAVAAGLGVGCISRIALHDALRQGSLKACRVPHRDFRRQFFFLLDRRKQRTPGIDRWLRLCREEAPPIREP
jgi:DNA-binding transcriptional LysR family regulator